MSNSGNSGANCSHPGGRHRLAAAAWSSSVNPTVFVSNPRLNKQAGHRPPRTLSGSGDPQVVHLCCSVIGGSV